MSPGFPPPLPPGRSVHLTGRGDTFVRETAGPPGAPTVLLLHGWIATADLNWWTAYAGLGEHFRVLAFDHRGHGRGIRSRRPFRLADCADDAAALIRSLDAGPVIAVGYSMGGPVAQLLWRRHPALVRGLVLCATSRSFPTSPRARMVYTGAGYGLALSPAPLRRRLVERLLLRGSVRRGDYASWLAAEVAPHRIRAVLEAGRELGRYDSTPWIGAVDVPTSVIVPAADELVPAARQRSLAAAIPGASLREVEGDHIVCARRPEVFVPALVAACREVAGAGRPGRRDAA